VSAVTSPPAPAAKARQVQLDGLRTAREVDDAKDGVVGMLAQVGDTLRLPAFRKMSCPRPNAQLLRRTASRCIHRSSDDGSRSWARR
jgi:hypothetical protein